MLVPQVLVWLKSPVVAIGLTGAAAVPLLVTVTAWVGAGRAGGDRAEADRARADRDQRSVVRQVRREGRHVMLRAVSDAEDARVAAAVGQREADAAVVDGPGAWVPVAVLLVMVAEPPTCSCTTQVPVFWIVALLILHVADARTRDELDRLVRALLDQDVVHIGQAGHRPVARVEPERARRRTASSGRGCRTG